MTYENDKAELNPTYPEPIRDFVNKEGDLMSMWQVKRTADLSEESQIWVAEQTCIVSDGIIDAEGVMEQLCGGLYELYFVTNEQESMVGYATVFPNDTDAMSCYLNKIQVLSSCRSKGIGGELLRQVMNDKKSITLINIIQDDFVRDGMARLYSRLGFLTEDGHSYSWSNSGLKI